MTSEHVQACLRFEDLFYRDELTDEESTFLLDHLSACPLKVHTPEIMSRVGAEFFLETEQLSRAEGSFPSISPTGSEVSDAEGNTPYVIPWLTGAAVVPMSNHTLLASDEPSKVEGREVGIPNGAPLRTRFPWLGSHVRVIRSFSDSRKAFVYQAEVDVLPHSEHQDHVLEVLLVDSQDRHSVAEVSCSMPRAMFVGSADAADWSLSLHLSMREC